MTSRSGSSRPLFPPVYRPVAVGPAADPFARARAGQGATVVDGTLFWSRRRDRLDCAIVLVPEEPVEQALGVACVAMVGLGDALGALLPPILPVTFRWPDQLHLNGALAGGLRLAWGGPPPTGEGEGRILLGVTLVIGSSSDNADPGSTPDRTTLRDEGCSDVGALELLEAFSRHFLAWVNRWHDDGFGPVRTAWLNRAADCGQDVTLRQADGIVAGRMIGLDDDGGLLLATDGQQRIIPLAQALVTPSWEL